MSQIEVLFENIANRIIQEIGKAQSSIYVAVAWLTDKQLFDVLLQKAQQGVLVRLMISNDETNQKSGIDYVQLNQIGDSETSLVNPSMGGLMHNKLCIIDRLTIITGSYNWTNSANNRNHENIFIFQDKNIAETCIHHFKEMVHHYLNTQPKSIYQNKNTKPTPTFDKDKADEQLKLAKYHLDKKEFELAFKYYEQAALLGSYMGQYEVAVSYKMGRGVAQNPAKAIEWLQKPASQGFILAEILLGECYYRGYGVAQDYEKAVKLFQKAAEQGVAAAQYMLAQCYYSGHGVPKDFGKEVEWLQKAVEQKYPYPFAQLQLGICYYFGRGVIKNHAKAFELFCKAAEKGIPHAQFMLGTCYEFGQGVNKDVKKAEYWYQKASEQNHSKAREALDRINFDMPF